jgi:nitrate reductase gamma subunit
MSMDWLSFARGPALKVAIGVFFVGVVWRILGFALLRIRREHSRPRSGLLRYVSIGLFATATRSWPHPQFVKRTGAGEALGYSYHLGLFAVILLFGPHVAFLCGLLGIHPWPVLPSSVITGIAVVTATLFAGVLYRRLTSRVMRLLSNFDDYFTWFITMLVMCTGLATSAHLGARYETLLAIHILSVDALLIWFPFGKLMHAFYIMPSRALNGAILARKGAPT